MKAITALIMIFIGFTSSAALPTASDRAVVVTFMGGFTGFDSDAYKVFRSSMASLLVDGVVDHFITTSWGREGGGEFCIELNPDPNFTTDNMVNRLKVIHPLNNTIYEYKTVNTCLGSEQ